MINITDRGGDVFIETLAGDIYLKKGMARAGLSESAYVLYYTKLTAKQSGTPILRITLFEDIGIITDEAGIVLTPTSLENLAFITADFFI